MSTGLDFLSTLAAVAAAIGVDFLIGGAWERETASVHVTLRAPRPD